MNLANSGMHVTVVKKTKRFIRIEGSSSFQLVVNTNTTLMTALATRHALL